MKREITKSMTALLIAAGVIAATPIQPNPISQEILQNQRSVVGSPEQFRIRSRVPESSPESELITKRLSRAADIDVASLATKTIPEVLQEIDQVENTWEFSPFFSWNSGTEAFYSDSNRVIELIDSLEGRFSSYTKDDSKKVQQLVEVIRAGFYHGWSHTEVEYLNSNGLFIRRVGPALDAAVNNPDFGIESLEQAHMIEALGAMAGAGYTTAHMANSSAPIFQFYQNNLSLMTRNRDYGDALYALGTGIAFAISARDMYNLKWKTHKGDSLYYTYSPFFKNVDDLYSVLEEGSLNQDIYREQEWLTNNYAYWLGTIGLAVERPRPQKALETFIDTYGKWPKVSLTALDNLDYYYDGKWADGTDIDMESIKAEVHEKYLPNTYRFENGTIIFKTGSDVDPVKLKKLVWAMREVRSQFYRYAGRDKPLEEGNRDDSLTAVIYNTPDEYKMNSFLYDVSTDNGGLYIDSWGTFFTYERTPQQSIYTLEDLFRHEFTHYLQGRYITPGLWNYANQSKYHMIWWDEGGAEYTAGSSSDKGITIRKSMVGNIDRDKRLTIDETIRSTYDDGFGFYTYSFVLFSYLHRHEPQKLLSLVKLLQENKLEEFAAACEAMGADTELETRYQDWMENLKSNKATFEDPITSDEYIGDIDSYSEESIRTDIESVMDIEMESVLFSDDPVFPTFSAKGKMATASNWNVQDSLLTAAVIALNNLNWNGYKTVTAYFTESGNDSVEITLFGRTGADQVAVQPTSTMRTGLSAIVSDQSIAITVPKAGLYQLKLYGLNGQILARRDLTINGGSVSVSLRDFGISKGMKILSIQGEKERVVQSVIVK